MKQEAQDKFIRECNKVHGGKYDYSITVYRGSKNNIEYICPKHGVITQNAHSHKSGHGCRYCAIEENHNKSRYTLEDFIKKMRKVYGDKYDFSQAKYVDSQEEITLICHEKDVLGEEHGEFWQTPNSHLRGNGCPKCKESKGERAIRDILENKGIDYEQEKTFDWLKYDGSMFLDFYLPDYSSAIEFQGVHHYIPVDFSGRGVEFAKSNLLTQKARDKEKNRLCKEHNIKIYYITYNEKIDKKLKIILENATTGKTNN